MPLRESTKPQTEEVEKAAGFVTKPIEDDDSIPGLETELEDLGGKTKDKTKSKGAQELKQILDKTPVSPLASRPALRVDKKDKDKTDSANLNEKDKKKSGIKEPEPEIKKQDKIEKDKKKKFGQTDLSTYLIKFQKVGLKDKIFFTKNLAVMLKAGLSLGQALHALAEQTANAKFKKILKQVEIKVKKGQSFADSLKEFPKTFPEIFISMIKSGETAGNLEEVLKQLHKQMKRDHELISKIKGAMIYPIIVITAMIGIGIAMMIFVIPKFITIFEEIQAELPLPTRILISLSHFTTHNGFFIALALIIIIGSLISFFRTKKGKRILHQIFLKLPVLSPIVKKINLARFTRTVSSMLKTNIPIVDTFKASSNILTNIYYKQALKESAEKIKKGQPINKSLAAHKDLFPPVVIQMATVGEESGSLDAVLEELANFYEDDIDQTMKNLPTIIEPILMLLLGLGVGAMAVAVLMPMYSLSQSI